MSRRVARELAFQVLFQVDLGRIPWKDAVDRALAENDLSQRSKVFLEETVRETVRNLPQLDETLSKLSTEWPLRRMANTDRNILRLAVYELLYRRDIPIEVTVNEAVELAKRYGEEESGRFVNGLLGNLIKRISKAVGVDPVEEEEKGSTLPAGEEKVKM